MRWLVSIWRKTWEKPLLNALWSIGKPLLRVGGNREENGLFFKLRNKYAASTYIISILRNESICRVFLSIRSPRHHMDVALQITSLPLCILKLSWIEISESTSMKKRFPFDSSRASCGAVFCRVVKVFCLHLKVTLGTEYFVARHGDDESHRN